MSERTNADFARWVRRMVDAGWCWWFWIGDEGEMWRHADEYEAMLTSDESRRAFLDNIIPDPYDVLRGVKP